MKLLLLLIPAILADPYLGDFRKKWFGLEPSEPNQYLRNLNALKKLRVIRQSDWSLGHYTRDERDRKSKMERGGRFGGNFTADGGLGERY